MDQNLTHRNHYIPRFYLKNWSLDGKTIQTYSILVSNSKVPYWTQQSIKNSAVWSDFYTRIEGDKEIDDFEHWFDREFETPAKPVFDKLLNGQKISYEESVVLSHFVFAQYVRTPACLLYTSLMFVGFALIFIAVVCSETKFSFLRKKKS